MTRSSGALPSSASSGPSDTIPADAPAPRFAVGQEVLVRDVDKPGHVRTPRYVRGARGVVTAVQGCFRDPESLGHGGDGLPERWLYQVAFAASGLWESPEAPEDVVLADIFEQWLSPVTDDHPRAEPK